MRQYRSHRKDNTHKLLLIIIPLVFLIVFPGSISAEDFIIPFPITINDIPSGEIPVKIDDSGAFLVSASDFITLIETRLAREYRKKLEDLPDWFTLRDSELIGIEMKIDEFLLEITVVIRPEQKPLQELSLASSDSQIYTDSLKPADFSFYANLSAYTTMTFSSDPENIYQEASLSISIDPVIQLQGWVVSTRLVANFSAESPVTVNSATLVKDFPDAGIRFQAGRLTADSLRFQNGNYTTGLLVTNQFRLNSPKTSISPLSRTIFLEDYSQVDIKIDEKTRRTLMLPPGPYLIKDFNLTNGINAVEITVLSDSGDFFRDRFTVGFDSNLLSLGESVYTYGIGYKQDDFSALPALFGVHRYGITGQATGAFGFQVTDSSQLITGDALYASPIGTFNAAGAVSHTLSSGFGASLFGSYTLNYHALPRLQAHGYYYTEDYTPFEASAEGTDTLYSVSLSTNFSLTPFVNISGSLTSTTERETLQRETAVSVGVSGKITPALTFSAKGGSRYSASGTTWQGSLLITYRGDGNMSISSSNDLVNKTASLTYNSNPVSWPSVNSISASISGISYETLEPDNISLSASMQKDWMNISFRQSITPGSVTDSFTKFTTSANLSAALAYAEGLFGASRPIQDSFVIVSSSYPAKGLVLGFRDSSSRVITSDNLFNTVVIPTISSNKNNRVAVDIVELPEGYDPGSSIININPGYRQGAVFRIENKSVVYLTGKLAFSDGVPAGMLFGTVTDENDGEKEPGMMFTDQDGTFFIYELTTGLYRLAIQNTGWNDILLQVEPGTSGLYDLGTLYLDIPSTQKGGDAGLITSLPTVQTPQEAQTPEPEKLQNLEGRLLRFDQTQAASYEGVISKISETDFNPISFTTGQAGEFSAEALTPGDYRIRITHPEAAEFSFTVSQDPESDKAAVIFQLDKPDALTEAESEKSASVEEPAAVQNSGQLKLAYSDGNPAAHIQGSFIFESSQKDKNNVTFFESDSNGNLYIGDLIPGSYTIRLFTNDFPKFRIEITPQLIRQGITLFIYDKKAERITRPLEYEEKSVVDLFSLAAPVPRYQAVPEKVPEPTYSFIGRLLRHDRTQAAFFEGSIEQPDNPEFTRIGVVTDSRGEFSTDSLPAGDYRVGFQLTEDDVEFTFKLPEQAVSNSEIPVFQLPPPRAEKTSEALNMVTTNTRQAVEYRSTVTEVSQKDAFYPFKIVYKDGAPASGIQGSLLIPGDQKSAAALLFFTTDTDGSIAVNSMNPGTYTIRLFTPAFPKYVLNITEKQIDEGIILFLSDDRQGD